MNVNISRYWPIAYTAGGATCLAILCLLTASDPWVARTGGTSATVIAGRALEWEWIDVGQSTLFVEGNPGCCNERTLTDQNAARMTPGLAVSVMASWLRDVWWAALFLTWVLWLATAWGVHALVSQSLCSPLRVEGVGASAGMLVSGAFVVTSPGFLAFVGSIDAHQFGYAGAVLGVLLVTLSGTSPKATQGSDITVPSSIIVGLGLFLCDGTMQLGVPLLCLSWVLAFYDWIGSGGKGFFFLLLRSGSVTLTYAVAQAVWAIVARAGSPGFLLRHNEASGYLQEVLASGMTSFFEISGRLHVAGLALTDVFGGTLIALALVGWVAAPLRVKVWAGMWVALIVAATLLTRLAPRTIYMVFPAVYVLAGLSFARMMDLLMWMAGTVRWRQVAAGTVGAIVTAWTIAPTVVARFGFLWGDLRVSALWWPYMP